MNKNETLKISTSEQDWLISIKSCDRERDGRFIRELTRENFYNSLSKTIGWNEDRYQEEPKFPERYLMLFSGNDRIGFLSLREQPNCFNNCYLYEIEKITLHIDLRFPVSPRQISVANI